MQLTGFHAATLPLSAIIINDKLGSRPFRSPNYQAENAALVSLAEDLANNSPGILDKLVDFARHLCGAQSAGISLTELADGQQIFRWRATSGKMAPFLNGTVPCESSPCAIVIERKTAQLLEYPARHYPFIEEFQFEVVELLLVPFYQKAEVIGTLWVVTHDHSKKFDAEDLRILQSLSKFVSTAIFTMQTMNALSDLHMRMDVALKAGSMATWIWDIERDRIHADENLNRMFGIADTLGEGETQMRYLRAIHPEDREHVRKAVESAVHRKGLLEADYRVQTIEGETRWVSVRGRWTQDPNSGSPLLSGVVSDITERRHAEDQLRIKTEQLAEAAKRKDEFLATLSHELRSPLTVIMGHSELLRIETPGSAAFESSLKAIARSAKIQNQLIADLLDVSRIVAGKMLLDIHVFSPKDIVADAVKAVQYAAEMKAIVLRYEIDEHCGMINGDRGRLQQALWNLLTNAVKFSERGGTVVLSIRRQKASIDFQVTDQGQGIGADFLPHVFDRFNQEDGSKIREHGGLGLGLAIVRHIAELHGGSVRAESRGKDQGAQFTMSIPVVALVDDLPAQAAQAFDENFAESSEMLADRRILVVDDQSEAWGLLQRSLEKLGAIVSVANSAERAWRAFHFSRFDILISDIGMPGKSGLDLIKTWRQKESTEGRQPIPAIALTAYGTKDDANEVLAAGFTAHLAKPAGLRQLASTIRLQLNQSRGPES